MMKPEILVEDVLADGEWHTIKEILSFMGACTVTSPTKTALLLKFLEEYELVEIKDGKVRLNPEVKKFVDEVKKIGVEINARNI